MTARRPLASNSRRQRAAIKTRRIKRIERETSTNMYPDCVCRAALYCQRNIRRTAPNQISRQAQIDLIKADKAALHAGKQCLDTCTPDLCIDSVERTAELNSSAEQHQKDLIALRPEVNRRWYVFLQLRIKPGNWFEALSAIGFDPQRYTGSHILSIAIGREETGRDHCDERRALRNLARAAGNGYPGRADYHPRRKLIIDLRRRNEEKRRHPRNPQAIGDRHGRSRERRRERDAARLSPSRGQPVAECSDNRLNGEFSSTEAGGRGADRRTGGKITDEHSAADCPGKQVRPAHFERSNP